MIIIRIVPNLFANVLGSTYIEINQFYTSCIMGMIFLGLNIQIENI